MVTKPRSICQGLTRIPLTIVLINSLQISQLWHKFEIMTIAPPLVPWLQFGCLETGSNLWLVASSHSHMIYTTFSACFWWKKMPLVKLDWHSHVIQFRTVVKLVVKSGLVTQWLNLRLLMTYNRKCSSNCGLEIANWWITSILKLKCNTLFPRFCSNLKQSFKFNLMLDPRSWQNSISFHFVWNVQI